MTLFVGIDGGGTRATAVVVDGAGAERVRVHGGAALVRSVDPAAGAASLADLVDRALRDAGAAPPAAGLCCALAGAGREPERQALAAALHREAIADRLRVVTDAEAALHDAFGDGPGILLIAGTGSIAWGRGPDGRVARAGGWGALLGDEGGAYAIGLDALRTAVRAGDGRGPETRLRCDLLEHTGVEALDDLIAWTAAASKAEVAALAPLVTRAAAAGDAPAADLVRRATRDLADHVAALVRRLGPWEPAPRLALAGALLAPGAPLREPVLAAIRDSGCAIRPLARAIDAARGAAELARVG